MTPITQDIPRSHWATASDYFELLKPRVMALVIFTALVGMLIAPAEIHPVIGFAALLAIAMGAGASGALNMWIEADIDRLMTRTRGRPIPTGRIAPGAVLGFGTTLAVAAVTTMGLMVNLWAGGLLAFTILFYVVIYTVWLKPRTPENIVIGGAAGALPPVVAWSAAAGAPSLEAWIPFLIIFLWTPPHFWALALFHEGDYARVGLPMLPVVKGEEVTRRRILIYALILAPAGVLPWFAGIAGPVYALTAVALGWAFAACAFRLWRRRDESSAKRLFGFSIVYLFALFAVMGGEALFGGAGG